MKSCWLISNVDTKVWRQSSKLQYFIACENHSDTFHAKSNVMSKYLFFVNLLCC
jgi:hypothetical protein